MADFDPKDANFEARVRTSFARQTAMATLGIEITGLKAGEVELKMPYAAAYPAAWFCSRRNHHHGARFRLRLCRVSADARGCGGADRRVQDQPDRADPRRLFPVSRARGQ